MNLARQMCSGTLKGLSGHGLNEVKERKPSDSRTRARTNLAERIQARFKARGGSVLNSTLTTINEEACLNSPALKGSQKMADFVVAASSAYLLR